MTEYLESDCYLIDGLPIVKKEPVHISERMRDAVMTRLFMMAPEAEQQKSRKQITELRAAIAGGAVLPPLVVEDMGDYVHVHDGNHRVVALRAEGVGQHPAIWVKRDA